MLETPVWALHDGMLVFGCESLDGVYVYRYDLNQDSMEKIRLTVDAMDHITSIAISPDGNTLAVSWLDYASGDIWDGGIQTVDLNTGKQTTLEANHVSVIRFISNSEFLTIECENVPFGSGGIDDKKDTVKQYIRWKREECGKIRPIICGHSMKILCMQMQQYMKIFSLTVKKGRRDLGQPGYTSDDH